MNSITNKLLGCLGPDFERISSSGEDSEVSREVYPDASEISTTTKVMIGLSVILGVGALVGLGGVVWHYGAVAHISVAGHVLPAPSTTTWVSIVAAGGGTAAVAGGGIAGTAIARTVRQKREIHRDTARVTQSDPDVEETKRKKTARAVELYKQTPEYQEGKYDKAKLQEILETVAKENLDD